MEGKKNLTVEAVYSPIDDEFAKQNINKSPIWRNCYKPDEVGAVMDKHHTMMCYKVKFDGLKPVQLMSVKKIK